MVPGAPCADAPVQHAGRPGWLLDQIGRGFVLLCFGDRPAAAEVAAHGVRAAVRHVGTDLQDPTGLLAQRYDGRPGTVYLLRPDQVVAARWRRFDGERIARALQRALGA